MNAALVCLQSGQGWPLWYRWVFLSSRPFMLALGTPFGGRLEYQLPGPLTFKFPSVFTTKRAAADHEENIFRVLFWRSYQNHTFALCGVVTIPWSRAVSSRSGSAVRWFSSTPGTKGRSAVVTRPTFPPDLHPWSSEPPKVLLSLWPPLLHFAKSPSSSVSVLLFIIFPVDGWWAPVP